jgi:hypothetical protein
MGQIFTPPIPTATKKLPKPKNQTAPQPKDRMVKLLAIPPHKENRTKIDSSSKSSLLRNKISVTQNPAQCTILINNDLPILWQ